MILKLPRLPVNWRDQPQLFERYWSDAMTQIEKAVNQIQSLPIIQEAIAQANAAAAAANAAAATANSAANMAQDSADIAAKNSSLNSSGTTGLTLTAIDAGTSATITISNHTRVYGDGTSVSVTGGSVTGLAYSTTYYIYYDQPTRAGGTVSYQTTTTASSAVQTGNRHLVGVITTPAAAGAAVDGDVVEPAGIGNIRYKQLADIP